MIQDEIVINDTTKELIYTADRTGEVAFAVTNPYMGHFYFIPNVDFSSEYPYSERTLFSIQNRLRVTNAEEVERMGLVGDNWTADNFSYSSVNLKGQELNFVVDKHSEIVWVNDGVDYWDITYDFNVNTPMIYDPFAETTYYSTDGEEKLLIPKTTDNGKGILEIKPVFNILDAEGNDYFREFDITIEMSNEKPLIGEEGKYDLVYQGWDEE